METLEPSLAALKEEVRGIHRLLEEMDKRYMQRFNSQEQSAEKALAATEKAVLVAQSNDEKWRQNANEWRSAMDDRESRFVMKDHLNPIVAGLETDLEELKAFKNELTGKGSGLSMAWGIIVTVISTIISILGAFGVVLYVKK